MLFDNLLLYDFRDIPLGLFLPAMSPNKLYVSSRLSTNYYDLFNGRNLRIFHTAMVKCWTQRHFHRSTENKSLTGAFPVMSHHGIWL